MLESISNFLLLAHIVAGSTALIAGFVAVGAQFFKAQHKVHQVSGQFFFWSMVVIFITAFFLSLLTSNLFLFLIALFSFYLALSGYCFAKNRKGLPKRMDWIRVGSMLLVGVVMFIYGVFLLMHHEENGVTMLAFACISIGLASTDLRYLLSQNVNMAQRISRHLTMMLAAFIATITAFVVVNFNFEPAWVLWLAPTVVVTPVIVYWNRKVLGKKV